MDHEATIRQNIELWAQQYNSHDAAGLAAWYTEESVYITPTGMALLGPKQVHDYFEASFKRSPAVAIAVQTAEVHPVRPDMLVGRGTFEIFNLVDPAGKPLPIKGPWVSTFVLQEGRWMAMAHASAMTLPAYVPAHT